MNFHKEYKKKIGGAGSKLKEAVPKKLKFRLRKLWNSIISLGTPKKKLQTRYHPAKKD